MDTDMSGIRIHESWKQLLLDEFEKKYFKHLWKFISSSYQTHTIYPQQGDIFKSLDLCPVDDVKVIIIGQDPYHGSGQANGLSFAVKNSVRLPPSLQNIFKEIKHDTGIDPFQDGDLSRWAKQGVLLLNATLTVEENRPGSHQGQGWEIFTDAIINQLSSIKSGLVFILWGNYAKKKGAIIDRAKHLVIESAHPSPFSAHSGFFGSKPFSRTNTYLKTSGKTEIDWR